MKTTIIKQTVFLLMVSALSATLLLPGCAGDNPARPGTGELAATGAVQAVITLGKVGLLGKRSAIEMKHLVITITIKEKDSVVIADTSDLTESDEKTVKKTFPELTAPEDYILTVTSVDAEDKIIHSGSKKFTTVPADTVNVEIGLDAKYSMFRVAFNNIPDSVTAVSLEIDDVDTVDASFDAGSEGSLTLEYDYLAADTDGIEYNVSLRASGSFYGTDTVLYAADTTIIATCGDDAQYAITLVWVGPEIPQGAAEITVTLGAVGTILVNAGFGPITDEKPVPTEYMTAYFPFNGDITDMSRSGISATNHGATLTTDRFGNSHAAYSFNGASDYIDLGNANPVTGNHFTISAWISVDDTTANPLPKPAAPERPEARDQKPVKSQFTNKHLFLIVCITFIFSKLQFNMKNIYA